MDKSLIFFLFAIQQDSFDRSSFACICIHREWDNTLVMLKNNLSAYLYLKISVNVI